MLYKYQVETEFNHVVKLKKFITSYCAKAYFRKQCEKLKVWPSSCDRVAYTIKCGKHGKRVEEYKKLKDEEFENEVLF